MLAHALGRQLAHPTGIAGRLVGHAMRVANRRPTRIAVEALAPVAGEAVLDLGCGPGDAMAHLLGRTPAAFVLGVDASAAMVDQARSRNAAAIRCGRAAAVHGEFGAIPAEAARFDGVLASNVMYFWHDSAPILAEIRRVLRPGGRIVAYVTEADTMRLWPFAMTGTHRLFDATDLRRTFEDGGFAREQIVVERVRIADDIHGLVAAAWC